MADDPMNIDDVGYIPAEIREQTAGYGNRNVKQEPQYSSNQNGYATRKLCAV